MSEFKFKRGKGFKVDDTFFKDNFDITGMEDKIYNQMAKTIARNVDIELAKTPLVDILTGYTRYKEAEYELQQKENIIKEVRNWVKSTIDIIIQQPTGNDEWILERLNSFISLLDKGE